MEPLLDPLGDRFVKTLAPPPAKPISHYMLFPPSKMQGNFEVPDWIALMHHLMREGRLSKPDMMQLVRSAMEIFSNKIHENNLYFFRKGAKHTFHRRTYRYSGRYPWTVL